MLQRTTQISRNIKTIPLEINNDYIFGVPLDVGEGLEFFDSIEQHMLQTTVDWR